MRLTVLQSRSTTQLEFDHSGSYLQGFSSIEAASRFDVHGEHGTIVNFSLLLETHGLGSYLEDTALSEVEPRSVLPNTDQASGYNSTVHIPPIEVASLPTNTSYPESSGSLSVKLSRLTAFKCSVCGKAYRSESQLRYGPCFPL